MSHDTHDTSAPGTLTAEGKDTVDAKTTSARADTREQREYELLLRDLPVGVMSLDYSGTCTFINSFAESCLGIMGQDAVGLTIPDLIMDDAVRAHLDDAMKLGRDGCPITREFRDGERIIEMQSKVSNDIERASCTVLTFENVTWRNEMNERKDQFLSLVSHELRTPLTVIRGYLDIFDREVMGVLNKEQKDCAALMLDQCGKLDSLIKDLIRFRDLSRGVLNAPVEPVVIGSMFTQVGNLMRAETELAGMQLTMATTDNEMACWCSADHLADTLRHLISNSIKFAADGKSIHVQATRFNLDDLPDMSRRIVPCDPPTHTQWAMIRVADRGPGLPAEALAGAFSAFVQGEPHLTRRSRGLGLGLPLVREIVDRSGGTLWIDSSEAGTRVSFILPLIHTSSESV